MVVQSNTTLSMEELPINDMNGQSFGFVVYRNSLPLQSSSLLKVCCHIKGGVRKPSSNLLSSVYLVIDLFSDSLSPPFTEGAWSYP